MTEPFLCPYCNAPLPTLSAAPASPKLPCPRCGEGVPAARWRVDSTAFQAGEPVHPARAMPLRDPRASIRQTLYIVLGIMAVVAVTGLSYMLWTTQLRRSRDPWMPTKLTPIAFRRPTELAGLGYLPKESEIVVAIQVAELVDDKEVGQKLLAEPRPALLDFVLKQVPKTTGMKIEQIDHLVLATSLETMPPMLTMVVQTRQPYSLKTISEAVQPAKASLHRDQPVFEFSLKPAGEAMLWCVSERTLIYIVRFDSPTLKDLQALSTTPRPVEEVLSAPVREVMTDRLPKHNFLWAAGRLDHLGAIKDFLPLMLGAKANLGAIKDMKTFAIGIAPIEGVTLTGHFHLNDAKAAAQFKEMLADIKLAGATSHKVDGPAPDAVEPAWVTWQVRSDVSAMRELLNQGKEMKK